MTRPQGRSAIRRLLDRHGHRPNKSLGQHFLADPNLVERIVRTAGVGPGDSVVEVGAGTGTLTRGLAATGARVVAYEVDRHLEPLLREALRDVDVELRFADVTKEDFTATLDGRGWVLVANLPYNVGTPLLLDILRSAPNLERFVVMVQREVAARIAAEPGSRSYGLPSVIVGLRAELVGWFPVGRDVFIPPPDVDSAVVELRRIEASALANTAERIAAAAFGQRRKMLRRSLTSVADDPVALLAAAGIDPTRRAEELEPSDYLRLAEALTR